MHWATRGSLAIVAFMLIGCLARPTIPPGRYEEYAGPGVIRFTSRHFHFLNAHAVEYAFWSDAGSSWYGKGSYRIANRKLILTFDQTSPATSSVRAAAKPATEDSLKLDCRVEGVFIDGQTKPLPGANIRVLDAAGNLMTGAITNLDGAVQLRLPRNPAPQRVVFDIIGWYLLEHSLTDTDTRLDVLP